MNWKEIGFKVGERGGSEGAEFAEVSKTCKEHGFEANHTDYQKGITEGQLAYCNSGGASVAGLNGWPDTKICKNRTEFLKAYKPARRQYLLETIALKERQLSDARTRALSAQSSYTAGGVGASMNLSHQVVINRRKEVTDLEDEIRRLDRELILLGQME